MTTYTVWSTASKGAPSLRSDTETTFLSDSKVDRREMYASCSLISSSVMADRPRRLSVWKR